MTYSLIYEIQMIALAVAIVMIVMARKGFNGFAVGLATFGVLLIIRRIDDVTGIIGEPAMSILSSLVVALYCYQVWSIWKERHDHDKWQHWREQWAEELQLIREYQARKQKQQKQEDALEAMREPSDVLSSWDIQWPLAKRVRDITRRIR